MSFPFFILLSTNITNCLHSHYNRRWNLRSALEYYDDQIDENHLSRIFIEPPDEGNTSCEESDDEVPVTVSNANSEVVLRSGKRLIFEKHSDVSSKCLQKVSDNKTKKICDKKSMITNGSKSDKHAVKTRPRRKLISKRNDIAIKTGREGKLITKNNDLAIKTRPRRKLIAKRNLKSRVPEKAPIQSGSETENEEGKHDSQI